MSTISPDDHEAITVAMEAAGAHLRSRSRKGKKAFMRVSQDHSGFAAVHEGDEDDMLKALSDKDTLLEASNCSSLSLEGPKAPTLDSVVGVYTISRGPYCVRSFEIATKDVIATDSPEAEAIARLCCKEAHALGEGRVIMHAVIRKKNTVFKNTPTGLCMRCLPGRVVYTLTISENGIVRFHLPPERWTLTRLFFGWADSESGCCSFVKNILHAKNNGCFCIGTYYESDGVPVLMRFNRWNEEVAPYWAAVRNK